MANPKNGRQSPESTKSISANFAEKIELRPDGWERFRQAVHVAAKSGPKHKMAKTAKAGQDKKARPVRVR